MRYMSYNVVLLVFCIVRGLVSKLTRFGGMP